MEIKYIISIVIAIVIAIVLLYIYYYKFIKENFEDEEDVSMFDNLTVLDECKSITPQTLFSLFNNDLNAFTEALVELNIPTTIIKNIKYYPQIATMLVKSGKLKCN